MADGIYKEKIVFDSAAEMTVMLDEKYAFGDIDGDSNEDAAVILNSNPGGSGIFYSLAVIIDDNGNPGHIDSIFLGDWININSVSIKSCEISIDVITQGLNDPMIRPTVGITRTFILHNANIVEKK